MANRERGELRLAAAGGVYTLRLTVGYCCELEDITEQDFDALTAVVNRGRATELRWLLWAVLQPYHRTSFPTVETITPLIDAVGRNAIRSTLSALLRLNTDSEPREEAEGESEPQAGTVWRRLYVDARKQGIPSAQFWDFSLLELWREMAAIRQRQREDRDARITQAWWNAMLVWQKQLPELETLLKRTPAKPKPQTWQEMRAVFRAITRTETQKAS